MKKQIIFIIFFIMGIISVFGQEYTIWYYGKINGRVVITKDVLGNITIRPISLGRLDGGNWLPTIDKDICYLLPYNLTISLNTQLITIEGNTRTTTYSNGSWEKEAIEGNTTIFTKSNGYWSKAVIEGNTTTTTWHDGSVLSIIVVEGNTTTRTTDWGDQIEIVKDVVESNTTTHSLGYLDDFGNVEWYGHSKTVVEGNITTTTRSDGSWEKTVANKLSESCFIFYENGDNN